MKRGKIGLAVGLLAVASFAGIRTPAAVAEETDLVKKIDSSVIESYKRKSLTNIEYKIAKNNKEEVVEFTEVFETKDEVQNTANEKSTYEKASVETANSNEKVEIAVEEKHVVENEANTVSLSTVQTVNNEEVEEVQEFTENTDTETDKEAIEVATETEAEEFTEIKPEEEVAVVEEENTVSLSLKGWITEDTSIKSGRGNSAEVIGYLEKGHEVVGEAEDGWIKISFNGMIGYVSESYLTTTEAVVPEEVVEEVETPEEIETPEIEVPEEEVIEEPVEDVVEEDVQEEEVYEEEAPIYQGGDTISNITSAAYSLVGSPYVWAGSSPSTGFDCSGLTSYLYREYAGVELARITTGQANNGYGVSKENIQPGDIILFQNDWSDHVDHVGIYVGNGEYVHAATEERGVVVDSTSGSYFQNNVVGVRRILN